MWDLGTFSTCPRGTLALPGPHPLGQGLPAGRRERERWDSKQRREISNLAKMPILQ